MIARINTLEIIFCLFHLIYTYHILKNRITIRSEFFIHIYRKNQEYEIQKKFDRIFKEKYNNKV